MKTNRHVLITGASSGIGYELAHVFARNKYNLILTARNKEKLLEMKKQLEEGESIKVCIIAADLCDADAPKKIFDYVKSLKIPIDILINNAGAGYVGAFCSKGYEEDLKIMQLNMISLTQLIKLFANEMIKQGHGRILNVASTGAYHPGPYTAVYYATKAYVLSLSEALDIELRPSNVTVSALCPGATKTDFANRAGRKEASIAMDPKKVAQKAYKGLINNRATIIPGIQNKFFIRIPRIWAKRLIANYQMDLKNK